MDDRANLFPDPVQRCPSFPADPLQGLDDGLLSGCGETDSPLLDDPALFARDLLQRVAEVLPVFEGDVGDDRDKRDDHVGGVQPAPQAYFQHGNIRLLPLKMEEGHCGEEFEIAHGLPNAPFHRFRAGYDFLAADHTAVDSDPFPKIDQIRRGVKPGPEPRRGQQRGRHRRHGAFAVGAGDQHGGAALLGIAEPLQEGADRIESETDSQGVQRL